jgi:pyruvate dehydrogenase E1 component beta subunit
MHRAAVRRKGRDLTIVSYSRMALLAQEAATELAKEGIEAEVIDLRSLSPIDWDTCVTSIEKTHRLMVVEEDGRFGGVGGEIASTLTERCFFSLDAPVKRVAGLDIPTPFNGALEAASIPRVPDIVEAARALYQSAADQEIGNDAVNNNAGVVGHDEQRPADKVA